MSDWCGSLVVVTFGTLYPAYSSYKAVKSKNTREYVKWMMYWIVFAFFNAVCYVTDIFLSWFPGYYLFKMLFILWLVSPATRGSTYLYKKVVHPALRKNEDYIDRTLDDVKNRGYDYTSQWARLAMQNFSRALMEAVFKGQVLIADQMQRQAMQRNTPQMAVQQETDGSPREFDRPNQSAGPEGRLYRVDSQMFDMDDEFIELSAEMTEDAQVSAARQRRRAGPKKTRPVSMPPATIEEQHVDHSLSDPDFSPEEAEVPKRRKKPNTTSTQDEVTRRVTRSSRRNSKNIEPTTPREADLSLDDSLDTMELSSPENFD